MSLDAIRQRLEKSIDGGLWFSMGDCAAILALLADTRAAQSDDDEASFVAWELAHQRTIGRVLTSEEHAIAESAWMSADTRAATEGSAAEAERERIIKLLLDRAEVDNNIVKPGLWFAAGWIRQNSPAASAPTREMGWIDEAVRVIQVLETDVFGQPIDRNVLRACITDAMKSLPAPPRDERPQTAERKG